MVDLKVNRLFLLSVVCSGAYCFTLPYEGLYRLDLVHYNDFHARFEETSLQTSTCRFNNASCLGGFPRLYSIITELLREKPDAVLLNAGDSFQGTFWYTWFKWNVIQEFMNKLPHDAHALGNHEFDDGPEGLAPYLKDLKAPVLAANMDVSREPSLKGLFKPFTVVERRKRKIGIIGLITTETKTLATPGNVTFKDPGEATKREAEALTDLGVDIIILLSHCGLEVDKKLARDYGQYIDIIVGGHSHSLLWNGQAPSGENVEGPYPVIVEPAADRKHKVLIVQASAFTKYIGNMTIYFDPFGDYVKWDGNPIYLDRSIPEDEEIKKQLEPWAEIVHEKQNVVIGESLATLRYEECVFGECALGNLLTDALVEYAKKTFSPELNFLAFIQRGNIKSSIPEGNITQGVLFELLPYNDRIEVFDIHGQYILEALERSVSDAWAYGPFKGPWVLQVAGLKVTYNISLPQGSRITSTSLDLGGTPVVPGKLYRVVTPTYLGDGGDGFTMFKEHKANVEVFGRDEEMLRSFIGNHSPLNPTTEERVVINS